MAWPFNALEHLSRSCLCRVVEVSQYDAGMRSASLAPAETMWQSLHEMHRLAVVMQLDFCAIGR